MWCCLEQVAFEARFEAFAAGLEPGYVATFYYSGHGVSTSTGHYIVPVDGHFDELEGALLAHSRHHLVQLISWQILVDRSLLPSSMHAGCIPLNPLLERVYRTIHGGGAFVLLDACRTGVELSRIISPA